MRRPKVVLVGARRTAQGLGPFMARILESNDVDVAAIVCSTLKSGEEASASLWAEHGIETRAYESIPRACMELDLEGAVIASPVKSHEPHLRDALDARLHTLAEKPFIEPSDRAVDVCEEIATAFDRSGLLLMENVQWPYTLQTFKKLHPEWEGDVSRFSMRMSPMTLGRKMLEDSLSHPISMIAALLPDANFEWEVQEIISEELAIKVLCQYSTQDHRVACEFDFVRCEAPPRPAWYSIDSRLARREIEMPSYGMRMTDGHESVEMDDPLESLIRDFSGRLHGVLEGEAPRSDSTIIRRFRFFQAVLDAWDRFGKG